MPDKQTLIALDGDEAVLKMIERVAALHYDVRVTTNASRLCAWLKETSSPDVIIIRDPLPGGVPSINILEAARRLHPHSLRILITAYEDLSAVINGLHTGAVGVVLQAPFTQAELLAAIRPAETPQRASA